MTDKQSLLHRCAIDSKGDTEMEAAVDITGMVIDEAAAGPKDGARAVGGAAKGTVVRAGVDAAAAEDTSGARLDTAAGASDGSMWQSCSGRACAASPRTSK
jgi:hypothetical protein